MANPDHSFKDLTVAELEAVAEQFAVDLKTNMRKPAIIKEIEENGVTFDMYQALLEPAEEAIEDEDIDVVVAPVTPQPAVEEEDDDADYVVVKMTRTNFTYQVRGYRFTRQHPYALVKEEDADYLIERDGGFRMASPREVREFYGA